MYCCFIINYRNSKCQSNHTGYYSIGVNYNLFGKHCYSNINCCHIILMEYRGDYTSNIPRFSSHIYRYCN